MVRPCGTVEPDRDSLRVELEVEREQLADALDLERDAVGTQAPQVNRLEAAHERAVAIRAGWHRARERDHLVELAEQQAGEPRHLADPAVMRDVDVLGVKPEHALDRLRKASGSNCTGVVVGIIQGPAAVSKSRYDRPKVSPVKKPRLARPRCSGGARVAGGVDEDERAAGELERMPSRLERHARPGPATSVPYERSISAAP